MPVWTRLFNSDFSSNTERALESVVQAGQMMVQASPEIYSKCER